MEWMKLDLNEEHMVITVDDGQSLFKSAFYKIHLRRYIDSWDNDTFVCRSELTYRDFKKIINICMQEAQKKGQNVSVSDSLKRYIDKREMYIEQRARLGANIKHKDESLLERYEEYKAVVDSQMSRKLRDKQMQDSFFMFSMKKSGNFSVPGSGKTASVLGMYAYLKTKGLVRRIVVICPKSAFGSWIDEFNVCFEGKESLKLFNVQDSKYYSRELKQRALKVDSGACNLILINYESSVSLVDEIRDLVVNDTLLVFDEVHRVKRIAGQRAIAALDISRDAQFVIALTGTPIPNGYIDIYNLLHILFPNEYNDFFGFQYAVLNNPSDSDIVDINKKIQPFFCRTTKEDLNVPAANSDRISNIPANVKQNQIFSILYNRYRKNKLVLMIRILQLESNPKQLLEKLDFSEFEYLLDDSDSPEDMEYNDYSDEIKELIMTCDAKPKLDGCISLVDSIVSMDKTVVVWCIFRDSIYRISDALKKKDIPVCTIDGDVPMEERSDLIDSFKNRKFRVLVTNPHTLGESVSLHTVCHDAIYFEYSYNLVHFLQSKDRIHRLGLPTGQYTQYYILQQYYVTELGNYSMDEAIYQRLLEKEKMMLDAIDNDMLEIMPTSEEDLDKIFGQLKL